MFPSSSSFQQIFFLHVILSVRSDVPTIFRSFFPSFLSEILTSRCSLPQVVSYQSVVSQNNSSLSISNRLIAYHRCKKTSIQESSHNGECFSALVTGPNPGALFSPPFLMSFHQMEPTAAPISTAYHVGNPLPREPQLGFRVRISLVGQPPDVSSRHLNYCHNQATR